MSFVDPDGNYFLIDDIIGVAIGAIASYVAYGVGTGNWLSGQAFAMAGVGAAAGVASLYTGGAAAAAWGTSLGATIAASAVGGMVGGAVSGLGGYAVGAAYGDHGWNGGDAAAAMGMGMLSGAVGGAVGGASSAGVGNITINGNNISSPMIRGAIGGAAGGYAGGFTGGLIASGGDFEQANKAGFGGMAMGATAGSVGAYVSARANGINPWTGKANNSITIGENQAGRVNPAARDLNSGTIADDWPSHNFNMDPLRGKEFNSQWIDIKMQENYTIYDIGPKNQSIQSPFYRMEAAKTYYYENTVKVYQIQINRHIRIHLY